jgi:hypothetical protein
VVVAGIERRDIGSKEEVLAVLVVERVVAADVGATLKEAEGATMVSMKGWTASATTRNRTTKEPVDMVVVASVSTIQAGVASGAKIRVRNDHHQDEIALSFTHSFPSTFDRTKNDRTQQIHEGIRRQ